MGKRRKVLGIKGTPYQFRVIQWNNHAQISNTKTGYEAARVYKIWIRRACLDNNTNAENNNRNNHSHPSTNGIGKIAIQERTYPSSKFEDRGQHALAGAGLSGVSLGLAQRLDLEVI